jgi:hypothetical protein
MTSWAAASQEALTTDYFIKRSLFCTEQNSDIIQITTQEHYFRMFSLLTKASPPESFSEIMQATSTMLQQWMTETENMITLFTSQYMNLKNYSSNFIPERFNPIVNVVWKKLGGMWMTQDRFQDWEAERESWMTMDEFTNLVPPQKKLIEEFEQMPDLTGNWMDLFPNMTIDQDNEIDTVAMFHTMKASTVDYLGLIFMAAFEYERDETFYTEDNTLETYWETFHPWLELSQCNSLVAFALSGKLPQINNIENLRKVMAHQVGDMKSPIKLENTGLDEFKKAVTEGAVFESLFKGWEFFTEENLSQVAEMSQSDKVDYRIEFDQIRIENSENCLDFVLELENFTSLQKILKMKNTLLIENHYYYFIEYLLKRTQSTPNEFTDKVRALRAVQIIYIFMGHILDEDYPEIKTKGIDYTIIHIILRIINGLDHEGTLRELVPPNVLDETTEEYIYTLLYIIVELNNFPKPEESDELNRVRKNQLVDDDGEDDFKFDPRGPKFAYIYNRLYKLSGTKQGGNIPYLIRYRKKFYQDDLIAKNPIYMFDDMFYQLELSMSTKFTERDYTFDGPKEQYKAKKAEYFGKYVKDGNNVPVKMLVKVFGQKYKDLQTKTPPKGMDAQEWAQIEYNKLFLEGFSALKSNFMEMQYVEAIILAVTLLKKQLPDFTYLFTSKMRDDDRNNMFEFIKRVFTNLKHTRSSNKEIYLDTVDINQSVYDDQSGLPNGERFHALLLDAVYFFAPEVQKLSSGLNSSSDARVQYGDLTSTIVNLKQSFRMLGDDNAGKELRDFRLMMTWNIFDDIEEYLPLVKRFIDETKSSDMHGSNAMKMEMLVENFTNMYIAILEHRIFAAQNGFSFENGNDRLANMMSYLMFIKDQYDEMFASPLPNKEIRYSKLGVRQVENLIYFMNYRLRTILEDEGEDASKVVLSNIYYPYGFREIYALSDNHPEMKSILEHECDEIFSLFQVEKTQRLQDYTSVGFEDEHVNRPNFKFCILLAFNKDMIGLIEDQAATNKSRDVMLTVTRESIFQTLVVPYYDKLTAHELVIQVFNLNMSHAKAVARESAEKFSNYIALLDSFLLILDDLEDGVNDTIELQNFPKGEISSELRDFCLQLERTNQEENKQMNLRFIRELLLEKLNPKFFAPGANLKAIYDGYTPNGSDKQKINAYIQRLRYGFINVEQKTGYELNPQGDDVDTELLALLMIYAPHNEFTAELLYTGNFMSKMPMYIRTAQDNYGYIYKNYSSPQSMEEVWELAHKRKMDAVKDVQGKLDKEANLSFDGELDIDLGEFMDEEDYDMEQQTSVWGSSQIEVTQSDVSSNVKVNDQITKVLVEETVTKVQLNSSQDHLEGKEIFIDQVIQDSGIIGDGDLTKVIQARESQLKQSDKIELNGINIMESADEFTANVMESKNIIPHSNSSGKLSFKIEDHNKSAIQEFKDEVAESTMENKTNAVFRLKVVSNNGITDEMQRKLFEQAAKKISQRFNADQCVVKVTESSVDKSMKQSAKMTTHISQEISEFNMANKEVHMSGSHNATVKVIENGSVIQTSLPSNQFNSTLINPTEAQNEMKQMIQNGISQTMKRNTTKLLRLV